MFPSRLLQVSAGAGRDGAGAEEIAGSSRHCGLTFCTGTWSEGGDRMGKSALEMIRDFGGRGKIVDVHFRNVSAPLPHFVETFPDDGYVDMYQVMKTLREVRFAGASKCTKIRSQVWSSAFRLHRVPSRLKPELRT